MPFYSTGYYSTGYTRPVAIIFTIILVSLLVWLGEESVRMALHIRHAKRLGKKAVSYSRTIPNSPEHILIIGDSTAYGTGAETLGKN